MEDIACVGMEIVRRRVETRLSLMSLLAAVAGGVASSVAPAEVAKRLQQDCRAEEGDSIWGIEQALLAIEQAVLWEPAVAGADLNATRFRDAARHIAGKALTAQRREPWSPALVEALTGLYRLCALDQVRQIANVLKSAPVALRATDLFTQQVRSLRPTATAAPTRAPTILLRFRLDGEPVSWPMALNTGRAYRLEAIVTADEWPPSATCVVIELTGDVPTSVIERPKIAIKRGDESGVGYLVPRNEINPTDSVLFTTSAVFVDATGSQTIADIVGQRSLRVSTFDPSAVGSGLPMVSQRIVELLSDLDARIPTLPRQDRRNLVRLLEATGRFAASGRDDLRGIDERAFQAILKQAFAQDALIGQRIQEAPKRGRGTTDLVLDRIVDELKVSRVSIDLDSAERFVRQAAHYASVGDCPVSVLTILDDSPKAEPPGVQSNYMRWAYPRLHGARQPRVPSMVAVVIIPVGFPLPSDWSARRSVSGTSGA